MKLKQLLTLTILKLNIVTKRLCIILTQETLLIFIRFYILGLKLNKGGMLLEFQCIVSLIMLLI